MAGAFSISPFEALKQAILILATDVSVDGERSYLHAMGK